MYGMLDTQNPRTGHYRVIFRRPMEPCCCVSHARGRSLSAIPSPISPTLSLGLSGGQRTGHTDRDERTDPLASLTMPLPSISRNNSRTSSHWLQ